MAKNLAIKFKKELLKSFWQFDNILIVFIVDFLNIFTFSHHEHIHHHCNCHSRKSYFLCQKIMLTVQMVS